MTIPKWLIPVLAVIAALAVAAVAVLIGTHFASPDVQIGATKKVTVPVIAPLDDPTDKKAKSEIIGKTTVTLPGTTQPVVPLGQQGLIDAITGSTDPHRTIVHHGGGGSGAAPAADPCSPATGPVPASCPAGTRGRIRADLPPMWVNVLPFAPAHDANPENPRCPASSSVAGEVPIGVSAPAPAHYEIQYWPTGSPSDRSTATVDTTADDRTAYNGALNDPRVASADLPIQHSCIVLHVDATLSYSGQVIATDDGGRASDPNPVTFAGDGGAVHPELEVSTIGDNLLVVSAVARDDQRVEFYLESATGPGLASCDTAGVRIPPVSEAHRSVTMPASEVTTHHWPDRFTQRYTQVTGLPFGSAVLVCARWFVGTSFPATNPWDPTDAVLYQSLQMVASPDKLVPTLTTTGFQHGAGVSQLTVSTTNGVVCRGGTTTIFRRSSADIAPTPYDLCSATFNGAVRSDSSGRYWSDPVENFYTVTLDQSTIIDHFTNREGLRAPLLPCTGTCAIPAPVDYRVWLDPSSDSRGWWDFQLVYHQTSGGSRLSTWSIGGVSTTAGAGSPLTGPTFDTAATIGTAALDYSAFTVSATVPITSNGPVDYTVRMFPADTSGPLQCPPGRAPQATGHLDGTGTGTVTVPGLCLRTGYRAQVTLVDATGIPAVWDSFGTDPARLWRGAFFTTPGIPSTLHYDFVATGPAHGYVSDLQIYLHSTLGDLVIVPLADPANGHCLTDGTLHVSGTMDGSLVSQVTEIAAQYRIRSTLFGGVVCAPAGSESIAGTTTLNPVTLSDLIHATPAVTLRDPAGHWTLMLSLVPTP